MASEYSILAEGLVKRYGETAALDGFDLAVRARQRVRPARPQRRRQDDRRADPHDARADGRRPGERRRASTSRRSPARCAGGSASRGRPPPSTRSSAHARTCGCSAGCFISTGARRSAAPRSCSSSSACSTRPTRRPKTFSGGMRRRLDLAASMILAPEVLFLDEPTTGLDPRGRSEVWDAVRRLAAGGTTVLLTTHYLDEADKLSDRIALIDRGRRGDRRHARGPQARDRRRSPGDPACRIRPTCAAVAELVARVCDGAEPQVDQADAARPRAGRRSRARADRGRADAARPRDRGARHRPARADARRGLPAPDRAHPAQGTPGAEPTRAAPAGASRMSVSAAAPRLARRSTAASAACTGRWPTA